MLSMSGRVPSGVATRRNRSVPVAALIGLLLTLLALPLCAAAFTCTMPCCEHFSEPMDDHGAMPAPACGTECSVQAATPAKVEVLLSPEGAHVLPAEAPRTLSEITTPTSVYRPLSQPCAHTRPLYVINDAFLI
jgi:hypothetical protein